MSDEQKTTQTVFFVSQSEQSLGPWTLDEIAARMSRAELASTGFIYIEKSDEWIALMDCKELQVKIRALQAQMQPQSRPKAPAKAPPKSASQGPTKESEILARSQTEALIKEAEAQVKAVSGRPENEALSSAFHGKQEKLEPVTALGGIGGTPEWFVQKGPNRYGPFNVLGLVRALQEKSIFEFDLIWKNGMDSWVRIAEHEAFHPDRIRELREKTQGESGIFFRRQHPRFPLDGEVIVHDNRSVWLGKSFEGSVGGSGLIINNATLIPGQVVLLHFAETDGLPSYNALCEVVSKKFQDEVRNSEMPIAYGVRFIKVDAAAEPKIQQYYRDKAKLRGDGPDFVSAVRNKTRSTTRVA